MNAVKNTIPDPVVDTGIDIALDTAVCIFLNIVSVPLIVINTRDELHNCCDENHDHCKDLQRPPIESTP